MQGEERDACDEEENAKKTKIPSHLYTASINLALPRGTRLYQPFGGARWMAKIRYRAGSRTLKISHNFIFFKKNTSKRGSEIKTPNAVEPTCLQLGARANQMRAGGHRFVHKHVKGVRKLKLRTH